MSSTPRNQSVVKSFKRRADLDACCRVCGWRPPLGLSALHESVATMLHAHHVVPIACGGPDTKANLVLLCPTHHAVAHKLGRMRVKRLRHAPEWDGPSTLEQVVREIRILEERPPEDFIRCVRAGRNFAALVETDAAARRGREIAAKGRRSVPIHVPEQQPATDLSAKA